jgi:hypothetical protein
MRNQRSAVSDWLSAFNIWKLMVLALLAGSLILIAPLLPVGLDWQNTYRPAALAMLRGESPFSVEIYYAAPWALIPLMPFALLPYAIGRFFVFLLGLGAFAFTAHRLGAGKWTMMIFMLSASVVGCLNNGNIEWMPLLGSVLPPQFGLILLAVKPQVGIGLGLYWLVMIWREKGFLEVVKVFAPVTVLLLLSFVVYGFWPLRFDQTLAWSVDNTTLGLQGMFIGGVGLVWAIRNRSEKAALASGPFFSPYVLQFTWSAALVPLLDKPAELLAAVVLLWVPVVVRVIGE